MGDYSLWSVPLPAFAGRLSVNSRPYKPMIMGLWCVPSGTKLNECLFCYMSINVTACVYFYNNCYESSKWDVTFQSKNVSVQILCTLFTALCLAVLDFEESMGARGSQIYCWALY